MLFLTHNIMHILIHKNFVKQYRKLSAKDQERFKQRRNIFLKDPFSIQLNNHSLSGEYNGFRSFNVTGNIRVIFEQIDETVVHFHYIGTHSELYS